MSDIFCYTQVVPKCSYKVTCMVPEDELLNQEVDIRCAHGDLVKYQLANVEMEVEGHKLRVLAGVAEKLPHSVLLGTDVPELGTLVSGNAKSESPSERPEAFAVMTRAQPISLEAEAAKQARKESGSTVWPTPLCSEGEMRTLAGAQ